MLFNNHRFALITTLALSLTWLVGCYSASPGVDDSSDTRDSSSQTQETQDSDSGSDTESEDTGSDTGSETEDTGSVTETGSETEDTTPPTVGSLSGTITLSGDVEAQGVAVTLVDASGDDVSSLVTEASGEYDFVDLEPGQYTVLAGKVGYVDNQGRASVVAGEATVLDLVLEVDASHGEYRLEYVSGGSNAGDPDQAGVVAKALDEVLSVRLVDQDGHPVTFADMEFAVVDGHSGGTMDSAEIVTGPDGVAANGYTLGTLAGENHIRVRSLAGGGSIHYYPQGLAGAPASLTVVSGNNQTGVVGAALALPLVVEVKDQYENLVPDATVSFAAASGGSANPAQVATNVSGQASSSWTLGATLAVNPAEQSMQVSSGAAEAQAVASNISRTPTSIAIVSGDQQSARSGQQLPASFVVRVQDDLGNPGYGYTVAWTTSTGGSVSPASSNIGQDGLAQARGTMGVLLAQKFFATIAGSQFVTFQADKVGDTKVSLTEPALVWPGYPDASAAEPADIEVPLTIRGTGFGPEARVLWNAGSQDEEELVPVSVTATKLVVNVSADHFEELGTYPVAVKNTANDAMQSFGFKVAHTLLAPSSQDASQCTKSILSGWEWVGCSDLGPDDEAYGQDGHHEEKAGGRWEANDNGTAYDNVSGLTWMRCMAGSVYNAVDDTCVGEPSSPGSFTKAQGLCSALDLAGHKDWRVPSLYEAFTTASLYPADFSQGLDNPIFADGNWSDLWTSTFRQVQPGMSEGYLYFRPSDLSAHRVESGIAPPVRCVRGGSVPREEYSASIENSVRIVNDNSTGLSWHACPLGTSGNNCLTGTMANYTWPEALAACQDLVAAGFDDWRLASANELMTLTQESPVPVAPSFFGFKEGEYPGWSFWSSTTLARMDSPSRAFYWEAYGRFNTDGKDSLSYYSVGALCVRMGY